MLSVQDAGELNLANMIYSIGVRGRGYEVSQATFRHFSLPNLGESKGQLPLSGLRRRIHFAEKVGSPGAEQVQCRGL